MSNPAMLLRETYSGETVQPVRYDIANLCEY